MLRRLFLQSCGFLLTSTTEDLKNRKTDNEIKDLFGTTLYYNIEHKRLLKDRISKTDIPITILLAHTKHRQNLDKCSIFMMIKSQDEIFYKEEILP